MPSKLFIISLADFIKKDEANPHYKFDYRRLTALTETLTASALESGGSAEFNFIYSPNLLGLDEFPGSSEESDEESYDGMAQDNAVDLFWNETAMAYFLRTLVPTEDTGYYQQDNENLNCLSTFCPQLTIDKMLLSEKNIAPKSCSKETLPPLRWAKRRPTGKKLRSTAPHIILIKVNADGHDEFIIRAPAAGETETSVLRNEFIKEIHEKINTFKEILKTSNKGGALYASISREEGLIGKVISIIDGEPGLAEMISYIQALKPSSQQANLFKTISLIGNIIPICESYKKQLNSSGLTASTASAATAAGDDDSTEASGAGSAEAGIAASTR